MENFNIETKKSHGRIYDIDGDKNPNYKHGGKGTRLYNIWKEMKSRCFNKNNSIFKYYGGKKIIVCNEWMNFVCFRNWSILNGYTDDLTIDRIDYNGNYAPDNCRWTTMKVQNNNKPNNRKFTIDGVVLNMSEVCEKYNISQSKLSSRINKLNWDINDAIKNVNTKRGTNSTTIIV